MLVSTNSLDTKTFFEPKKAVEAKISKIQIFGTSKFNFLKVIKFDESFEPILNQQEVKFYSNAVQLVLDFQLSSCKSMAQLKMAMPLCLIVCLSVTLYSSNQKVQFALKAHFTLNVFFAIKVNLETRLYFTLCAKFPLYKWLTLH